MVELQRAGRFGLADLYPCFNNKGSCRPEERGRGNFSGTGASLPAEELPPPGRMVNFGVPFLMPDTRRPFDNMALEGQEIALPPGRWARAHFLGASDLSGLGAEVTLLYRGWPAALVQLRISAWNVGARPEYGERPGPMTRNVRTAERDAPMELRLWHQNLDLDPDCELLALRFEDVPSIHVFALTLEEPRESRGGAL